MSGRLDGEFESLRRIAGEPRTVEDAASAIRGGAAGPREFASLLAPAARSLLEPMALHARALTQRHFGQTMGLYVPLYLSNHCSGGCAYCGFASDREQPRRRLELPELVKELKALSRMGFGEVLLLTGERVPQAGPDYLCECLRIAADHFPLVGIEAFPMTTEEYRRVAEAGCTSVTLYQETYDRQAYDRLHRWGPKKDFLSRLDAPARALEAGLRTVGLGVLLGLSEPIFDALCLWSHARDLMRRYWRSGITLSFPRLRPEAGGFAAPIPVGERTLAQFVLAFRIAFPEVPLVLSTRERPELRDGLAGLGISKMSAASRTTVGGYDDGESATRGQFDVSDERDVETVCAMLRSRNLEPVFKNWDSVYR
jgi:2-iminoacetate synthase